MLTRELLSKVGKIEIKTRRIVDEITGGAYHSVFKGRGIEFSEVREYDINDDVRDIDWNVTARTGTPYIKKYVEERELTVIFAVDISASGAFGTCGTDKREKMAEAAALLAFSAIRNNDKAGLLLFTDKTELYLPPRSGRKHVLRIIRELVGAEPEHRKTSVGNALESLARALKRRSVVFLISDFVDAGAFERPLKILSRRHDVAAIRVLDPFETELPSFGGTLEITDSENDRIYRYSAATAGLFTSGKASYRTASEEMHNAVRELFRRSKVDMIDIKADEDILKPLLGFFRMRERRAASGR